MTARADYKDLFPAKLHYVLEQLEKDGLSDVISWQPHGKAFLVKDARRLEIEVLPYWFQQKQWSSFQRQLNHYEFKRITSGRDRNAYYHPCFVRDEPELCRFIRRIRIKGKGHRKPSRPDEEPNFYDLRLSSSSLVLCQIQAPACLDSKDSSKPVSPILLESNRPVAIDRVDSIRPACFSSYRFQPEPTLTTDVVPQIATPAAQISLYHSDPWRDVSSMVASQVKEVVARLGWKASSEAAAPILREPPGLASSDRVPSVRPSCVPAYRTRHGPTRAWDSNRSVAVPAAQGSVQGCSSGVRYFLYTAGPVASVGQPHLGQRSFCLEPPLPAPVAYPCSGYSSGMIPALSISEAPKWRPNEILTIVPHANGAAQSHSAAQELPRLHADSHKDRMLFPHWLEIPPSTHITGDRLDGDSR